MSRPGVGLVEDGDLGFEHGHLQDLVALLLAAREPLVQVAVGERRVHAEALHPLHEGDADLEDRHVVDALPGAHRLAEERAHGDARDLLGVLERQEDAGAAAVVGAPDVMSSPQKRTDPPVTWYSGLPMRAEARVDLPDPLGPMRACTSPAPTVSDDAVEDVAGLAARVQVRWERRGGRRSRTGGVPRTGAGSPVPRRSVYFSYAASGNRSCWADVTPRVRSRPAPGRAPSGPRHRCGGCFGGPTTRPGSCP